MKHYQSYSSAETKHIASALARRLARSPRARGAAVVALSGELGAGKTTFVKGFVRGLGSRSRVISPTFILMRRHAIHHSSFTNLYHLDAYRLKSAKDLAALDFKKILADPRHIVLIEWAEQVKKILPKNAVHISFRHSGRENEREIVIK